MIEEQDDHGEGTTPNEDTGTTTTGDAVEAGQVSGADDADLADGNTDDVTGDGDTVDGEDDIERPSADDA